MKIDQFFTGDIETFLHLALSEGWISSKREMVFLLEKFPQGCLTCRDGEIPVAFITAIKYDSSGWIGNLIVREGYRGRGIGFSLMQRALAILNQAGAQTVWLTASRAGRPIYEKLGFFAIDSVHRWTGEGFAAMIEGQTRVPFDEIVLVDIAGWGDRRHSLLESICSNGEVFADKCGFLAVQRLRCGTQLGPWANKGEGDVAQLLDSVVTPAKGKGTLFLDVPGRNVKASSLLESRGFLMAGESTLMYRGAVPCYNPGKIYALASMGSMG
jgi:GNAT superfamily N-acetyltransferase